MCVCHGVHSGVHYCSTLGTHWQCRVVREDWCYKAVRVGRRLITPPRRHCLPGVRAGRTSMKRKHEHELLPRAVWARRSHAAALVSPCAPSAALPSVLARLGADERAGMFTYHTTRNGASSTERIMCVCSGRWRQRCIVWMHRIVVACSVSVCASRNPGLPVAWRSRPACRFALAAIRGRGGGGEERRLNISARAKERNPARA